MKPSYEKLTLSSQKLFFKKPVLNILYILYTFLWNSLLTFKIVKCISFVMNLLQGFLFQDFFFQISNSEIYPLGSDIRCRDV